MGGLLCRLFDAQPDAEAKDLLCGSRGWLNGSIRVPFLCHNVHAGIWLLRWSQNEPRHTRRNPALARNPSTYGVPSASSREYHVHSASCKDLELLCNATAQLGVRLEQGKEKESREARINSVTQPFALKKNLGEAYQQSRAVHNSHHVRMRYYGHK